jgi:hypothetical protein
MKGGFMSQEIRSEKVIGLFRSLLEETFEKVSGIYLDGGTSLLETLAGISASEASKPITVSGTSIASQVDHLRFYFKASNDYINGISTGKAAWQDSWKRKIVTDEEWDRLRRDLADDYHKLIDQLDSISDWNDERYLGSMMGMIVHTAYHLGAIRQIQRVAKGE